MLNECIEERIRDLKSTDREKVGGTESRDLLTYMIEERELQKEDLTIADIRGHVSYNIVGVIRCERSLIFTVTKLPFRWS